MKATYRQVINGKVYNVGDDLPEFGSLYVTDNTDGVLAIQGKSEDFSKLSEFSWAGKGSTAYFLDTQDVYIYDGEEWIKQ